jgi:hypothetical protein
LHGTRLYHRSCTIAAAAPIKQRSWMERLRHRSGLFLEKKNLCSLLQIEEFADFSYFF